LKIRIEGEGHSVEIDGSALDHTLPQVAELAEDIWNRIKPQPSPRQQMGFAGQILERGGTPNIKGDPTYQYGGPAEA